MADPCVTDWVEERAPGRGWVYDQAGMTYDDALFDGFEVLYNQLGFVTTWTFEDPIDGCNDDPEPFTFQDGTAYTFQDGTSYEFN